LINAAAYTGVQFSPDVNKDGGYLLLWYGAAMCEQGVSFITDYN